MITSNKIPQQKYCFIRCKDIAAARTKRKQGHNVGASVILDVIYVFIFEPSLKHGVCSAKKEENRLFLKALDLGMILLQIHSYSIQV